MSLRQGREHVNALIMVGQRNEGFTTTVDFPDSARINKNQQQNSAH